MFFAPAVRMRFGGLLGTHPPLEERIKRVHPQFQLAEYRARRVSKLPLERGGPPPLEQKGRRASDISTAWGRTPEQALALIGTLDAAKVDFAARLVATLPPAVRASLEKADSAAAVMVALLLAEPVDAMERQLEAAGDVPLAARSRELAPSVRGLGASFHLPVVDLALAAVRSAPEPLKKELLAVLEAVINADRRVSLHEFVVLTLVRDQLFPRKTAGQKKIVELKNEAAILLSVAAHAGQRLDATGTREAGVQASLEAGAAILGVPASQVDLSLQKVSIALEALRALMPMEKAVLVKALFAAATADGTIRVAEAELLRLVGAVLDCPVPPLLDSLLLESL